MIILIHIPSRPQAEVPGILRMTWFSVSGSTGNTVNEHAPTRGSLDGILGSSPCTLHLASNPRPNTNKVLIHVTGGHQGHGPLCRPFPCDVVSDVTASMNKDRISYAVLVHGCGLLYPPGSSYVWPTARPGWHLCTRPTRARQFEVPPGGIASTLVTSVTGGAAGLRILTAWTGACKSTMGTNTSRKRRH